MLSRIVPANRKPSWGTIPSWRRSESCVTSRRSCPSIVIRPAVRVVEAGQQLHQRRLAGAGVADQRHGLARLDVKVDAVAAPRDAVGVAEAARVEVDRARDRVELTAAGLSVSRGCVSITSKILSSAALAARNVLVELRQLLHRVEEVRQSSAMNANSVAEPHLAVEEPVAAVAQHDRRRHRRQQLHEREVQRVQETVSQVGLAVGLVDLGERS